MFQFEPHPVGGDGLATEPVRARAHRSARHVGRREQREPLRARPRAKRRLEHARRDLHAGRDERRAQVAGDLRIRQQIGEHAGDLQRPHVERFEQRPEEEPLTVRALIEAIVRRAAEGRAPDRALLLLEPRRRQDLRGAVQPADHDALPESRAHAFEQCRADRGGHAIGLAVVGQRRDEVDGRAGVRRLSRRDSGQRGEQVVRRGQRAPAARLAVGRRPDVDQPFVRSRQGDTVETERLEHTRHRVEDRHVGVGNQALGDREICGTRQIQHQAPLVAIPRQIARLVAAAFASRRVDLDHLGAEITQMHGRHRRGAVVGEVEDADVRKHRHRSLPRHGHREPRV